MTRTPGRSRSRSCRSSCAIVQEALDDRGVPEVRVAVVHVEDRDVHEARLRRRLVARRVAPARSESDEPRRDDDLATRG